MQAILAKYPENKSDYLLPIIKAPDTNERSVYRNVSYSINQRLKTIAEILSINMPLTMYVARHSGFQRPKLKVFLSASSAKEWDTIPSPQPRYISPASTRQ